MQLTETLEQVRRIIVVVRGQRVILDGELAALYGVETRVLLQSVKRNAERFPSDFMFQLTVEEAERSRSQIVILNAQPSKITRESPSGSPARLMAPAPGPEKRIGFRRTESDA
jgi:hypothetical protein